MTARGDALKALHYALAPIAIAAAALLHFSALGPFLHPTGLFILGVIAAAWFGGVGPGFFAALIATLVLPQLIEISYPLTGGWLDLPRFVTFTITGLAVGWGTTLRRNADAMAQDNAALQRSEERYAIALSSGEEGFWDWDLASGAFHASPRMLEMCGFPPDSAFADRSEFLARFPFAPGEREKWQAAVEAHFAGRSARIDMEIAILRDGETRWLHTSGMATRSASGAVVRWTGATRDVTARRTMEAALRDSAARFRSLTELSNDFFWETDAEHRYTALEHGAAYRGPRNKPKLGKRPWELNYVSPDEAAWSAHRATIAARKPFLNFAVSRIEQGEERFYEISGEPRFDADGRFLGYRGVGRDVTERMYAGKALHESEKRHERAMAAAEAGFWDWDVPNDAFYVSPRFLEMGGFDPATTFAGRDDFMRQAPFHPDDRVKYQRAVRELFAGTGSRLTMELRVLNGGETRWHNLNGICFRDADGKVVRWAGSSSDVTERRRAEEALRISEQRYARAMDAAEAGHWEWNVATDEMFVSARQREMLELPLGLQFAGREAYLACIPFHPDDRERYIAAARRHIAEMWPRFEQEFRVILKSGELRWMRLTGRSHRDAEGRPTHFTGSLIDITERKLAEDALRASEERYSLAMEASDEGHFDVDLDTDQLYISERLNEIYGFASRTRFASRTDYLKRFQFHAEDGERYLAALKAVEAKGGPDRYEFEYRIVRPSGEVRWLRTRGKVIRDAEGRARRRTGVVADITEAKLAEEALRENQARYARAMEATEAGHWEWDLVTHQVFHSPRFRELYGIGLDETFADREAWKARQPLSPSERERQEGALQAAIADPAKTYDIEVSFEVRPGELRWLRSRGKVFRGEDGRPLRVTGATTDITARKLAEDARRLSEERYALAMEASEEGHFDWDVRTDEIFASTHLMKLLDLPEDEQFHTRGDMVARVRYYAGDRARLEQITREVLASSALQYEFEYRLLRGPAREARWIRARWKILRDAEGVAERVIGVVSDITERKLAVEALRERETRFRSLTELSADWYWKQDENLRFIHFSGSQAPIGKTRWELPYTPLSSSWDEHRAALAARQPFRDFEYSRVEDDGRVRCISVSGMPLFDEDGRFRGYEGVARDITERRRIGEELRSRQEMLELAQKAARAVPWEWRNRADPAVNRWSPELEAMFGLPPGAYDGTVEAWRNLVHPDDWGRVKSSMQQALETGKVDVEYRVVHPDGKVRWLNQKGRAFFDAEGRPLRSIGFMFDVTERRKVEDDLRSRQEMLELAQKSARAIAFEWRMGAGEGENRWSPDLEAMYGFAPGTYDGSFEMWKKLVHPEDWPAVKEAIKRALSTGEVASEYRVVHLDGSVHWLQAKGRVFVGRDGKPARMVGFMQDVTQRKHAEEEMSKLERELRRAQRLEGMGTMAGGIAHDFNNILGAILGYGEMAMRDAKSGTRLRRDLDSIMAAGERGRALVERILAFSRSGVGERVPVHVEEVVREALDQLAASLPENVTIAPRLRAGRAAMLGDSTQVHQVVMNLANNGVQAMLQGGVLRVTLETIRFEAPRTATVGAIAAGDYIVFKVADTGTGIPPDVLERMFDPFFTTKEVGVGSGLGLSLVHGIVTNVGGAIDVATDLGKGSSFTVFLPRTGDAPAKAADENRPLPRGEGQRVLVVDDEEPLVRLATETLERLGYDPVGFTSSTAALAAFRADPQHFDAVLTDERMPGLSGTALIREVRGIRETIPVVLMSGYLGVAPRDAREGGLADALGVVPRVPVGVGADVVVKKPLSARDLAASMARALQH